MTPLRVLHVVPHLDRVGGYERQALALTRQQQRRGQVAPILLTHHDDAERPAFERGLHGEIHRLHRGLRRHHPGPWWRRLGGSVQLVHAHALHKLSGQLLALGDAAGVPGLVKVATCDDVAMFADPAGWRGWLDDEQLHDARGLRWRLMMTTAWRRLRRAGTFVALNASIARQLADCELLSVRLPNGVDTARFQPADDDARRAARARLGIPQEGTTFAYAGRVAPRKNTPTLVRAFLRLLARGDCDSHLVVAGDGQDLPLLRRLVEDAGQHRRVTFLGTLDDVLPVLAAADVFIHPSRREGMPNAVLEALATGLAVVLSDIEAHREMLAGRPAALTFPLGDEASLAARLANLACSPARRRPLGLAARALACQAYDLQSVEQAYQRLYTRLRGSQAAGSGSPGANRDPHGVSRPPPAAPGATGRR